MITVKAHNSVCGHRLSLLKTSEGLGSIMHNLSGNNSASRAGAVSREIVQIIPLMWLTTLHSRAHGM